MMGTDTIEVAPPQSRERIFTWPFVNLMVANGLVRFCTYMLITLVPLYVIQKGMGSTVAGLTTTFYMLAAMLLRPTAGRLVDTRGRYIIMVLGAALYCVSTGLYVLSLPVWLLLAARVLQGVGFSFNGTAVMTLATDIIPEKRMSEGIGYLGVEQTVAQVAGPLLALTLMESFGYQVAFATVFAFAIVNVLIRFPMRRRLKRIDAKHFADVERRRARHEAAGTAPAKAPFWYRIVDRGAWKPSLIMFLIAFGTVSVNTFLAAYALGHGIENSGWFYTASGVLLAVARFTMSKFERRFGTGWTLTIGMVLIVGSMVGIWWSPNLLVLIIAGALYGFGLGTAQPTINSLAVLAATKENRGLANSTFFMALDFANAIGALALGVLADVAGLGSTFAAAAVIVAGTLVIYLGLRARGFVR